MNCRICQHSITEFLSLGKMPLVNSFLTKDELANESKYDLRVGFCSYCYLVQLMDTIDPEKLFKDYIYFSSTSSSFLKHCQTTATELTDCLKLNKNSLVLEIASNDGAFLQFFKKVGIKVLGIDPASNIAWMANQKGIETLPEFFNFQLAQQLKDQGIKADLVYGANVLAHVPEIIDFVKGVEAILKPAGTAVFEFPYLQGLMEKKFDIIYHEHVFYYSLLALKNLFAKADLEIYDVNIIPLQGGSLQIFVARRGEFKVTDKVQKLVAREQQLQFDKLITYQKISEDISLLKNELIELLDKIKKDGKTVAAYSAPAKGNILLNYFGIDDNYLEFIVDKSKEKQGLYTPGTHLLVQSLDKIDQMSPDYLLVLCWNIADEIRADLDYYHQAGGRLIIPLPQPKII